ncbi:hypothetical protein PanWU01x14_099420 [Parasponia andersonii]|uniref:Uncharacterized protein n=1 Tax=Parasponia andersonii TaxID=3476 RepID=A0A2P5D3X4_PARAD|nr:hypothetical protein PanWU01x14_099420 [Parasponia andersonii]
MAASCRHGKGFSEIVTKTLTRKSEAAPDHTKIFGSSRIQRVLVIYNHDQHVTLDVQDFVQVFGNLATNVSEANARVSEVHECLYLNGFFEDIFKQETNALATLDKALNLQDTFLREKSLAKWLVRG